MKGYVDGFLIPVKKDKVEEYMETAQKAGEVWMENGALGFCENSGDDLEVEGMLSFKKAADASDAETVIFSWIFFESREHRDKVNAAVMKDERMNEMMCQDNPVFDVKRMAYGGFETKVKF